MPQWLYDALTVLPPLAGLWLAVIGTIAFFVMLIAKTPRIKYAAAGVYVVGAFGFANVIVRFLY